MKNIFNFLLVIAIMVFIIGCNCRFGETGQSEPSQTKPNQPSTSQNENKSQTDKPTENIGDGETTGVPECDDLMKFIKEQSKSSDDNWVTKGIREYIFSQFQKALKESLEKNKDDKGKMAEQCKDLKEKLDKQLQEEKAKQQ